MMMSNVNQVQVLFSGMTLAIILVGGLLNSFEKYLPTLISQSLRYGKLSHGNSPAFLKKTEVPKEWFKHFYVYSAILSSLTLVLLIAVYLFNFPIPLIIIHFLNIAGGENRVARVSSTAVLLATTLLTLQCCRRFYDTQYVSIFSKEGRINITQYMVGYLHYTGAILAILVEAPLFVEFGLYKSVVDWNDLSYLQLGASVLFIWSWWHQYKVTKILANLRKDRKGSVITQKHKVPHGDWFNYVSSPHNLAEILMYSTLTIILWGNITWLYVLGWVLVNQIETALLTHWWYQDNFTNLPKHRKAIVPFIY